MFVRVLVGYWWLIGNTNTQVEFLTAASTPEEHDNDENNNSNSNSNNNNNNNNNSREKEIVSVCKLNQQTIPNTVCLISYVLQLFISQD